MVKGVSVDKSLGAKGFQNEKPPENRGLSY
jgi:hypothetical protein